MLKLHKSIQLFIPYKQRFDILSFNKFQYFLSRVLQLQINEQTNLRKIETCKDFKFHFTVVEGLGKINKFCWMISNKEIFFMIIFITITWYC